MHVVAINQTVTNRAVLRFNPAKFAAKPWILLKHARRLINKRGGREFDLEIDYIRGNGMNAAPSECEEWLRSRTNVDGLR